MNDFIRIRENNCDECGEDLNPPTFTNIFNEYVCEQCFNDAKEEIKIDNEEPDLYEFECEYCRCDILKGRELYDYDKSIVCEDCSDGGF